MAGEGAYEAGTVDTIQRMLGEGKLPWGETCAVSGVPTAESIELYVECERVYFKEDHRASLLALAIALGAWWALLLRLGEKNQDAQGRQTLVRTPLRVAIERQPALNRKPSQRRLRKLLRTVPIYGKLLNDYPKARIIVGPIPVEAALKFDPGFASR
jgi:hypothetical protein